MELGEIDCKNYRWMLLTWVSYRILAGKSADRPCGMWRRWENNKRMSTGIQVMMRQGRWNGYRAVANDGFLVLVSSCTCG